MKSEECRMKNEEFYLPLSPTIPMNLQPLLFTILHSQLFILHWLAAISGALAVILLARRIDIGLMFSPAAGRTVAAYAGQSEPDALARAGDKALARLPLLGSLLGLPNHLRWLALTGGAPEPAMVAGQVLLLGGVALLPDLLLRQPILLLLAPIAFLLPYLRIRNRAHRIRAQVERSLPELAAILAAEMAAGLPPDQALERAATWTGPVAALLRQVGAEARRRGRPIFPRGGAAGMLVQTIRGYDLPSLRAFAMQVDAAASRGVAGPELMNALVRTYIVAYEDKALQNAEKLETRLAVPSVLFFFLPLLLLILAPLMMPVLKVL